jgi:subtilisin family serine protease
MNFVLFDDSPVEVITSATDVSCWQDSAIGLTDAWKLSKGEGVRVAVLDTGWTRHPDLAPNIKLHTGFTGDTGYDTLGHGTHVAGIVGAAETGKGVVGVAPKCELLLIKVIPADTDSILLGLGCAQRFGADIINMSWGGMQDYPEVHKKLQQLYNAGIVLVAAAGNLPQVSDVAYPARYSEVIGCGALDSSLHKAVFSPSSNIPNMVAMPGVDILSCWLNNGYARLSGTSAAAPMLSGVIALAISAHKPKVEERQEFIAGELKKMSDRVADFDYVGGLVKADRI